MKIIKIIKDTKRQINIHPLVVYFILTPELEKQYGDAINHLKKRTSFSRNIFTFNIVPQVEEYCNDALSKDLTEALSGQNILVRLVDDSAGYYYYAVGKLDFNQPDEDIEGTIHSFITDVCKRNIVHLEQRLSRYSSSSEDVMERQKAVTQLLTAFKRAVLTTHYRRGTWQKYQNNRIDISLNNFEPLCYGSGHGIETAHNNKVSLPSSRDRKTIKILTELGMSEDKAKIAISKIWELVDDEFSTPEKSASNEIAMALSDSKYGSSIKRDHRYRNRPKIKPQIKVEIKKIVSRTLKNGGTKQTWGVEFLINDTVLDIDFKSKDQTMIYVCTLLRSKMGEKMYIHEFFNNSKGTKSKFKRENSREWIQAIYRVLFANSDIDFDKWISNIINNNGRPLNQGKSQVNAKIDNALKDSQPNGIFYCILNTKKDSLSDSFYNMYLTPEDIIIPKELQFLIDQFEELVKPKK